MSERDRHNGPRPAYIEKLKDPRWQKMRLQILERDNWTCQDCGETTVTLNVHHRYYLRNADPWEYPEKALITLCEDCHERETEYRPEADQLLLRVLRERELYALEIGAFATALRKLFETGFHQDHIVLNALIWMMETDEEQVETIITRFLEGVFKDSKNPASQALLADWQGLRAARAREREAKNRGAV